MIKINDTLLDASLMRSGDTLTLSMPSDMTLDALAELMDPGSAPEVRVLDEDGMTAAIYRNHDITSLTVEIVGDARQVTAVLKVASMEQTAEDRLAEKLSRAEDIIGEHDAALCEVADMAAGTRQMSDEADSALVELAGMIAELMERVEKLEAKHAQDAAADDAQGGAADGPQDGTTDETQGEGVR